MSETSKNRRVRVITDPEKYREHRRQKLLKKLTRWLTWAGMILVSAVLIWMFLNTYFKPRPLD
jgi:hypothetical protein